MGRRGHVRVKPPEYGGCITDWAQGSLCDYLDGHGLVVNAPGEDCGAENADHWEIAIPERERENPKPGEKRFYYDYGLVRKAIADLRAHPDAVVGYGGGSCGDEAAGLLEEGLAAAERDKSGFIFVDWW